MSSIKQMRIFKIRFAHPVNGTTPPLLQILSASCGLTMISMAIFFFSQYKKMIKHRLPLEVVTPAITATILAKLPGHLNKHSPHRWYDLDARKQISIFT